MRIGIMQPYFLPYIGYFQLINAVDTFVVYDNIQYTKKGWINRNRFLRNNVDATFSIALKKDSDFLNVDQRQIAESFDKTKLQNQFRAAYHRAPYFSDAMPVLEAIIEHPEANLFRYIRHSIATVCDYLNIANINDKLVDSSRIDIDHTLQGQNKVIAICEALGGSTYINPNGGTSLYSNDAFAERSIELRFLQSRPLEYRQLGHPFVPWLSIVDVMMFMHREHIPSTLNEVNFV